MSRLFMFCVSLAVVTCVCATTEVCTNSLLPGAKGDQGETGEEGEEGKLGKNGPSGLPGMSGEPGLKGDMGLTGKMGSAGEKGDKGHKGLDGPGGLKGKPGTTCDCGRYRKVLGQLDVSISKLKNAVKFLKNVVLDLRETEEKYYFIVKEPKRFREASMNCKLRGGILAMPKTNNSNSVMASYISQAGLTRVYVGVQAQSKDTTETSTYTYADSTPLSGFAAWSRDENEYSRLSPTTNTSCVELLSTGTWGRVECEATMFFICEFPKSKRRGGRGGGRGGTPASASL